MMGNAIGTGRLPVIHAYLAFGDAKTDPPYAVGEMHFDAILSEHHERAVEITDHPVESGVNVTDHVRPMPDHVTLEVFVSNVPVHSHDFTLRPLELTLDPVGQVDALGYKTGGLTGGTSALLAQASVALGLTTGRPTSVSAYVKQREGTEDYVTLAYQTLCYIRIKALLCTVHTPKMDYRSMILKSVTLRRDPQTGTSGYFTLEFQQIRVVQSSVTTAPIPTIPAAAPVVKQGKKDAPEADDGMQSVALRIRNAVRAL